MLNEQQQDILDQVVNWFYKEPENQVFEIGGGAGTGKTYLVSQIILALGLDESQFLAVAYTGAAALVLRGKGFVNACTIHSALYQIIEEPMPDMISEYFHIPIAKKRFIRRPKLDESIKLIIVDEGYMVPEYIARDLMSYGVKILVSGDPNQLPPIGGKPAFLTNPNNIHMLTKLMRQAEDDPIVYLANRA